MKLIVAGALVVTLTVAPATAHAAAPAGDTGPVPTITGISLGLANATTTPASPCVDIPIAVSYATNGDYVYQIDVYVTRGTLPSSTTNTATQLTAPGTTTGGALTGTLNYCPSTQGVGELDAGPSIIHYAAQGDVEQSTADDPATSPFDVQQASLARLSAQRHHKRVVLHASEAYYGYQNGALHRTISQVAYLQYFRTYKKKWVTIAHAKPSAKHGYASFSLKSKQQNNYRVVFAESTTIAAVVSSIITK